MIFLQKEVTVLLAVLLSLVATSANAESLVTEWTNPGSFPFQGNYSDVCVLYAEELSEEQCVRALLAFENDTCEVYSLKEGDVIDVSFTSDKHYRKVLQVAFGEEIPADDPRRNAFVCDTGRADGLKLVRPDICGNWSLMTLREPAPPVTVVASRQPDEVYGCWLQSRHTHGMAGDNLFLPGFDASGFCEEPHFVPGLFLEGATLQSNGQSLICGWYPAQQLH